MLSECCIGYFPHRSCLLAMDQHCTGKNLVQCCPRVSRQHCTGKNPVQCCVNTLGAASHRCKNLVHAMLSKRCSRQHCTKKIVFNVVLILLGQHCTGKYPAMLSLMLQTTMHRKKYCSKLSYHYSWDNIAQVRSSPSEVF